MHGWCENFSWYSTVKNVARFLVLLSKKKICLGKSREISNKLISKIQDICKTIFYKLAFAKEPCLLLIHFAYNWKEFFRTNCANDKKSLPFGWYYINRHIFLVIRTGGTSISGILPKLGPMRLFWELVRCEKYFGSGPAHMGVAPHPRFQLTE